MLNYVMSHLDNIKDAGNIVSVVLSIAGTAIALSARRQIRNELFVAARERLLLSMAENDAKMQISKIKAEGLSKILSSRLTGTEPDIEEIYHTLEKIESENSTISLRQYTTESLRDLRPTTANLILMREIGISEAALTKNISAIDAYVDQNAMIVELLPSRATSLP